MLNNILQFIFSMALNALGLYLLATLSTTFFIFEWRLSVFDISMWGRVERLIFLIFLLSYGFVFTMPKIIVKHWG